jgi:hypothetical protein
MATESTHFYRYLLERHRIAGERTCPASFHQEPAYEVESDFEPPLFQRLSQDAA